MRPTMSSATSRRHRMGVLVDVQRDGDRELGCAVGRAADEVGAERQVGEGRHPLILARPLGRDLSGRGPRGRRRRAPAATCAPESPFARSSCATVSRGSDAGASRSAMLQSVSPSATTTEPRVAAAVSAWANGAETPTKAELSARTAGSTTSTIRPRRVSRSRPCFGAARCATTARGAARSRSGPRRRHRDALRAGRAAPHGGAPDGHRRVLDPVVLHRDHGDPLPLGLPAVEHRFEPGLLQASSNAGPTAPDTRRTCV